MITEELYDSIFDINVKGLLFTVEKALPLMPDGASIILNASIVTSKGLSATSVYSATKAAVRSFARTWTTDLKRRPALNLGHPAIHEQFRPRDVAAVVGGRPASDWMASMADSVAAEWPVPYWRPGVRGWMMRRGS